MNKNLKTALGIALPLALPLLPGPANAQSNLTLYGIADVSVRYLNHADAAGHDKLSMENGAITNSRWGLRGVEDLGGGTRALFTLEGGINLDNGTQSNSSKLFNRQAFVGLQGRYGKLTLGVQNTPLFDLMSGPFDPLTLGNYNQNGWLGTVFTVAGKRGKDNTIRYEHGIDSTRVVLYYGFGEAPGGGSANAVWSGTLTYASGSFATGGGFLTTHNGAGNAQTVYNLNAAYVVGRAKLFAGYFYSNDETGFVDAFLNGASVNEAARPRRDNAWFAGATYSVAPAVKLTGAFYQDRSRDVRATAGDAGNGVRNAVVATAEYAFSARTAVYATVDYNWVRGAASVDLPTGRDQLGAAIGIRHKF